MFFLKTRFLSHMLPVCFLLVFTTGAYACSVPVFRYALEHWHPDPYRAVILHRRTLSEEDEVLVAKLEAMPTDPNTSANMIVRRVDVEQDEESPDLTELLGPDYRESLESPEIALLYPQGSLSGPLAWRGRLTAENVDALVRSPARSQITDWILAGESAVWVLVGAGNAVADKSAEETLRTQLDLLENELKLRDMEIIEAESQFGKETKVELRLGLKLLVLDRTDPKEKIFAAMLLRSEENLEELGQPVAIPVYGRGRAFLALAGKGIKRRNIEESCRFLIGDCSCEVKRQNPGVDLLFALNWDEQVVGSAGVDPTLPDLVGIGLYSEVSLDEPYSEPNSDPVNPQTEESDKSPPIDTQQDKSPPVPLHVARESAETPDSFSTADETASGSSSFGQRLTLWLALLIALGVVFAAIATVRLRL